MASTSFLSNTVALDPTHALHPSNIFNVEGLIAVVTGGGTGKVYHYRYFSRLTIYRHWAYDGDCP